MSNEAHKSVGAIRVVLTRATAAALKDADLVGAMTGRDPMAWGEWDRRFRLVLEQFARKAGIPRWDAVARTIAMDGECVGNDALTIHA